MSKTFTRVLAIILAAVVFGGAFYIYRAKPFQDEETTPEAAAVTVSNTEPNETPVRAVIAEASSLLDYISVNGSTVAREEVNVSSEVAGKITKILFQEGSYVKAGTPLVQLDNQELEAQRERLAVQQELSEKIAERLQALYEREGVSLQEYEIAASEAKQVEAEVALLDVQLEKRTIRAPFGGVLGLRQVSEGTYLSPGLPIVRLVSTNPIDLEFTIPEKYSSSIERGGKVSFTIDGSTETFEATILAKDPNIDPETRTLRVKASATNRDGTLLPGAFTQVRVDLKSYDNTILLPTQAIIPELGGKSVYIYRNGIAESVEVETGIRKDALIQVLNGVEEGDTVITTGVLQIRPGAPVRISQIEP